MDLNRLDWNRSGAYEDIWYDTAGGIAKITINRPEVRNAFRPKTIFELADAFNVARDDPSVGVIIFTGAGDLAFCSGGDQRIRGDDGYVGNDGVGRLNVLDLQIQMRRLPKPIIAMVAGYAIGGGHILHLVSDLTIAADNARFGQTGPKVGSFDGGYGAGLLARTIGQKKAREIWYLCDQYDAQEALDMGLVHRIYPQDTFMEDVRTYVRVLTDTVSPHSMAVIKAQTWKGMFETYAENLAEADRQIVANYPYPDYKEGVAHFVEKRPANFPDLTKAT